MRTFRDLELIRRLLRYAKPHWGILAPTFAVLTTLMIAIGQSVAAGLAGAALLVVWTTSIASDEVVRELDTADV